ncbi:hypothetical protein V1525DRAFT_335487 [Lipomyces kononenkoae]|uniref:Uncharacterized protein n=1 Tax=Lipomyces kononenkoae TaxID=34357 RepID=A0ACC3TAZ2_LIPKO
MQPAELHKEAGNALFSQEDYEGAIREYTKAIIQDASNPAYFTNRALCRLRLHKYEEALADCQKALELTSDSMKAHFYKAQALLALDRPNEALRSSKLAYEIALKQKSPSASSIAQTVLNAKKSRWEVMEQRRVEKEGQLLFEMKDILHGQYETKIKQAEQDPDTTEQERIEAREILEYEYSEKVSQLEHTFERSDDKYKKREVPDYLIDPISFNVFYDPVVSKSGQSFERSVLLEHLKHHKFDPFTREYLTESDLRPNLSLKAACEKFLEENGWAVDY